MTKNTNGPIGRDVIRVSRDARDVVRWARDAGEARGRPARLLAPTGDIAAGGFTRSIATAIIGADQGCGSRS